MSRTKNEVFKVKSLPKILPDGLEEIQIKATIKTGKTVKNEEGKDIPETIEKMVSMIVPQETNAGVIAYQKFRMENGVKEDNFVAHAVRTAHVKGTLSQLTAEKLNDSKLILPNASKVRITDETEANGKILAEKLKALKASGKKPSAKDLEAMLAELMG